MSSPVLNAEQLARLRDRFQEYSQDSHYRANALAIRSRAHAVIRELTVPDNLPKLSLDDFDEHIWRLGNMWTQRGSFDWHHAEQILGETSPDRFVAMLDSGELWFVGNVTWGSGAGTLGASTRRRSPPPTNEQLETQMRQALTLLLHRQDAIDWRLRQVMEMKIGFGQNVSSGLLMAWHPQEFILYNTRPEQCWAAFGLDFKSRQKWVKPYLDYNGFCRTLLGDPVLALQNLVDLDVFVYWHTVRYPGPAKETKSTRKKRGRRPKATQPDITLEQLTATKREMPPERFLATWGDLYEKLVAEEVSKLTTDVAVAQLGQRAKRRVAQIHDFLHGRIASSPTAETLCDWIQFCYAMELHREAAALLPYVSEEEVDVAIYRRAKRLAEVSRTRLTG